MAALTHSSGFSFFLSFFLSLTIICWRYQISCLVWVAYVQSCCLLALLCGVYNPAVLRLLDIRHPSPHHSKHPNLLPTIHPQQLTIVQDTQPCLQYVISTRQLPSGTLSPVSKTVVPTTLYLPPLDQSLVKRMSKPDGTVLPRSLTGLVTIVRAVVPRHLQNTTVTRALPPSLARHHHRNMIVMEALLANPCRLCILHGASRLLRHDTGHILDAHGDDPITTDVAAGTIGVISEDTVVVVVAAEGDFLSVVPPVVTHPST